MTEHHHDHADEPHDHDRGLAIDMTAVLERHPSLATVTGSVDAG